MAITNENASDMIAGIRKLNIKIHNELAGKDSNLRFQNFHIRYIANIDILAMKECISLVHE